MKCYGFRFNRDPAQEKKSGFPRSLDGNILQSENRVGQSGVYVKFGILEMN